MNEVAETTRPRNCIKPRRMGDLQQNAVWPVSGGSCGELIRSYHWTNHPLGPPVQWSQRLKGVVESILDCSYALVVLWGEDLFQIYNDVYSFRTSFTSAAGFFLKSRMASRACSVWDF